MTKYSYMKKLRKVNLGEMINLAARLIKNYKGKKITMENTG